MVNTKKIVGLLVALCLMMTLFAMPAMAEGVSKDDIKIGFIYIGDENEGYTQAHYVGARAMQETLGLSSEQLIFKENIPETNDAYEAAVDLAENGCDIIFANSFGHGDYVLQAAEEYPDVEFCHATGATAASSGLDNVHNYFTSIYEARYVSGVVAGMKLNDMISNNVITAEEAKIGYVGAHPFAEVVSGYTSFFLGARSVCPTATMDVIYTGSWSDAALEKATADALIAGGAKLISQHSDTTGPSVACEEAGVPIVGYNVSMIPTAPTQALTSAVVNWAPYVTYAVEAVINGTTISTDWCEGYAKNAVKLSELNANAVAEGTVEKVAEVEAALKAGTLKVFDCATFTVGGETVTTFDKAFGYEGNELVWDGYFHESELRSAPCFELRIDGITEK